MVERTGGTDGQAADDGVLAVEEGEIDVDEAAARRRVEALVRAWQRAGVLEAARRRTRTVSAAAVVVLAGTYLLSGTATGLAAAVVDAWLTVGALVSVTVGAVHLLLRGLDGPEDVRSADGAVARFGIVLLAAAAGQQARSPATRAAWRYLLSDVPAAPDRTRGYDPTAPAAPDEDDPFPLARYVRWAAAGSAAVVLADQAWLALLGRESVLTPVLAALLAAADGDTFAAGAGGLQYSAAEAAVVLVGAVLLGGLLGLALAVRR